MMQMSVLTVRQKKHTTATHLALTRFEPVEQMGDRADVVGLGEEDELPVDEVGVVDPVLLRLPVVQECALLDAVEPTLPILDLALAERHLDEAGPCVDEVGRLLFVHFIVKTDHMISANLIEVDLVYVKVRKIILRFAARRCPQTLVVLGGPSLGIVPGRLPPRFILGQREESLRFLPLRALHDGGDKSSQEALHV